MEQICKLLHERLLASYSRCMEASLRTQKSVSEWRMDTVQRVVNLVGPVKVFGYVETLNQSSLRTGEQLINQVHWVNGR